MAQRGVGGISAHSEDRRFLWVVALGLLVLCVILFQNSWHNPFVLDDLKKIVENPDLLRLDQIFSKLVYPYREPFVIQRNDPSRPMVYLLYALAYHLGGGDPFLFHLLNTGVHWLCGVAVFLLADWILEKVREPGQNSSAGAALAAVLFLVLPIQAGTAVYIYGLSDLLSSVFILFSLYAFARYLDHSRVRDLVGCIASFVLALLSKQSSVMLPALFFLLDLSIFSHWNGRSLKKRVFLYLGLISVSVVYLGFRWIYFGGIGDLEGEKFLHSQWDYFFVQGVMILKYLGMTWVPLGLSIDHAIKPGDYPDEIQGLAWAVLFLGVVGVTFLQRRQKLKNPVNRIVPFSILFYGLCLFPTSSFLPTVDCFVERRVYLANFAWVLLVGAGMSAALESQTLKKRGKQVVFCLSFFFILLYSIQTFARNRTFSSQKELWLESLNLYPRNVRALNNLGNIMMEENKLDESVAYFEKALEVDPKWVSSLSNLGIIYSNYRFHDFNPNRALQYFQKAIEIAPKDFISRYNAAEVYAVLRMNTQAEALYLSVIQLNPTFALAYRELADLYRREKRLEESKQWLEKAKEIDPEILRR